MTMELREEAREAADKLETELRSSTPSNPGGWQSADTLPLPPQWLKTNGQRYLLASFYVPEDFDVPPEPTLIWAHVAYLTADGWMSPTAGIKGMHGNASFPLNEATHWKLVDGLPPPPSVTKEGGQ